MRAGLGRKESLGRDASSGAAQLRTANRWGRIAVCGQQGESTMSHLPTGPTGTDPTSGSYVAALDASDSAAAALSPAARERRLPRGVVIGRPGAMRMQRRLAAAVVLLPLVGTLLAVYQVVGYGVGSLELGILA